MAAAVAAAELAHEAPPPTRSATEVVGSLRPVDVRLRREISHRRLAVAIGRRLTRLVTLQVLDGALLVAVSLSLAAGWTLAEPIRPYVPAIVTTFLLSLHALAAYGAGDARRDRRRLFWAVVLASLILTGLSVFPPFLPFSAPVLGALGGIGFLALVGGRMLADAGMRQVYARGFGLRRAVVIGSLDDVGRAIVELRDDNHVDQFLLGHLTPGNRPDPASLGTLAELPRVFDELDIQEVLLATSLAREELQWVAGLCFEHGVTLYLIPAVVGTANCRAEPLQVGACPLLRLHPERLEMPSLLIKRGVDLAISAVALLLLAPVIALIAAAIVVDSPGPVVYRQKRVGLGGRIFTMWKFRSMACDAEAREKELAHLNIYGNRGTFKLRDDPRVTRIGRILRRTSLDELPQLINVLRGEMSLVGPRPALTADIDRYEPHHFERLTVVPGLTGPWQVSGRNLITDFETIIRLERHYIRNWSLWLDLKILLRTVKVVVRGEGAY